MIKYEKSNTVRTSPATASTESDNIHRLENLVVVQNQKIENLERDVRRLKNELRTAVSAFNQTRRNY